MQRDGDQPATFEHRERALVLAQAVGERAVELQPVAVRPHAAVAQQIARVLVAEQVLAGRHRARIELGERGLQRVVERIARLLVPEQRIVAQHLGVGDGRSPGRSGRWRRRRAAPALPISSSTASMRGRSSSIDAPPIFILTTV